MDFEDIKSAICKNTRCNTKNDVIEFMIQAKHDESIMSTEDKYY